MKTEYCARGENMLADLAHLQEPTLAVLSAISKEKGQEYYRIYQDSVNVQKFKEYLQELRARNGKEKIALLAFMNLVFETPDTNTRYSSMRFASRIWGESSIFTRSRAC